MKSHKAFSFPEYATQLRKSHATACEIADGEPSFDFPTDNVRVIKANVEEKRIIMGIVLEPEVEDSQADIYSADQIEEAAHKFMEDARNLGVMHRRMANDGLVILQSFIAPVDFEINGQAVKKGSWILVIRVKSDIIWAQVKRGEFTGLSIGGSAIRTPEARPKS